MVLGCVIGLVLTSRKVSRYNRSGLSPCSTQRGRAHTCAAAAESCFIFLHNSGGSSRGAISGRASKRRRSRAISSSLSHPNDSQSAPDRLRIWLVQFPVCPSSARNPVFALNFNESLGDLASTSRTRGQTTDYTELVAIVILTFLGLRLRLCDVKHLELPGLVTRRNRCVNICGFR